MRKTPRSRTGSNARSVNPTEVWGVLAAVGILLLLIVGYLIWASLQKEIKPIHLLVGVDVSGSIKEAGRKKVFGVFDDVIDTVLPKGSDLSFWAYDVNARKAADVTSRKSRDLWKLEDEIIATDNKTVGTHLNIVLKEMLPVVREMKTKEKRVAIMLLTDGEDRQPDETQSMVIQLAAMDNLKAVWIAGATARNGLRSDLERKLKPLLGDRLIVSSDHDTEAALSRFRSIVEEIDTAKK